MPSLPSEARQLAAKLRIGAHQSFQGRWAGERRGRSKGAGLEFADYRAYQPGDDLRYVDWHLYARHGRLYLKAFLQEQNLPVIIMLDVSRSMGIGEPSKLEHAKLLVTFLCHAALSHLETVQVIPMAEGIGHASPVLHGRSQMSRLEAVLSQFTPGGQTDLERCAAEFLRQQTRAGVVFLITDLFGQTSYQSALKRLAHAGNEAHLLQVLAPEEIEPSVQGDFRVTDIETGVTREVRLDETTLRAYRTELARFWQEVHDFASAHNITFTRSTVGDPLMETVLELRRNGVLHG